MEVVFRFAVFKLSSLVELFGGGLKISLHKVNIILVILVIDSWVLQNKYAKLMERLSHFPTLFFYSGRLTTEVSFDVNDRYFVVLFHLYLIVFSNAYVSN